ncbi:magnesium transporter MgtE N-terminal domain-containing protein [Candidatus Magnetominusculus dajiuhuensis]|uniref:magnesium transporter MgtE N-terminal domain-containing protein n=1 Tax=Candidatus Magnetominusculus dajiuhuensis TaxID=3137712 RepID=UPI003B43CFC2
MNTIIDRKQEQETGAEVFFLSDLIGTKVFNGNEKIGKLMDLAIVEKEKIPRVTHFIIHRPFGSKALLVPWERVATVNAARITVELESLSQYEGEPPEGRVLLNTHILDKKVLDMDDNEVDMVYDIKLALRNRVLYVTDVDFSRYALLKRLGLKPIVKFLFGADFLKKETLSWAYVQPLPENTGAFKGNVKLNVLKEKLTDIHPVDLADILEELNSEQRLAIFNELETEHASDTLEEIEPRVQRELICCIRKERAAELINDMTPAQAADILAILPAAEADEIMKLIDKENAQKVQFLLDKHEEELVHFSTSHFIKLPPRTQVSQLLLQYREIAKDKDVIMYIYVVDEKDTLLGVVDLKEALQASIEDKLEAIMTTNVIALKPENTLIEAAEMFSRYSFRAIPVTNGNDVILGVVLYRDVMNLKHRFV